MRQTFFLGALLMLALSGCPGPAAPEADTGQPAGDTGGSSPVDGGLVAAADGSAAATDAGEEPALDGSAEPGDAAAGHDASKPLFDGGAPLPDGSTVVTGDGGLSRPDAGFSLPDAGGVPPSDVAAFCAAYMDAAIAWAARCFGSTEALWRAALDSTTCDEMVAEVGAGRAAYDPAKANACLAAVATMPCEDTSAIGAVCGQAVFGKATAGQACYVSLDCAPKGACTATGATCPGVCQDFLAQGQACGGAIPGSCQSPLVCTNGVCSPPPGEGEPCAYSCAAGLWCDYNSTPATCKKLLKTGDSCTTMSACGGLTRCKGLVYYPLTPGTCQPTAGLGQACVPGEYECQMWMSCDAATSKCAAYGSVGDPCWEANQSQEGRSCMKSWCNSDATPSVCTAYDEPGAPCTANSCRLGSCLNGFCESQCVGP